MKKPYRSYPGALDYFQTQKLKIHNNKWDAKIGHERKTKPDFFFHITGPSLPNYQRNSAMARSPDGRGVLLFGGDNTWTNTNTILELRAEANSWTILNITLQIGRSGHIVIPLHWFFKKWYFKKILQLLLHTMQLLSF